MAITRVTLVISLLARSCIPISVDIILEAYYVSLRITTANGTSEDDSSEALRHLTRPQVGEHVLRTLAAEAEERRA